MGLLLLVLPMLLASAFAGVLQHEKCGHQKLTPDASGRLVGGAATLIGEFPWLAALHYINKNSGLNSGIKCSGVVINKRYVLTAAHCLHVSGERLDAAWLGVREISKVDTGDIEKVKKMKVEKFISHEKYNPLTAENDIALLKLDGDIVFSEFIRQICLPLEDAAPPSDGTYLTVAGWGAVGASHNGNSDMKLKVDVPIHSHAECERMLGGAIKSTQFCAEGDLLKGTCWGDGGGPLMLNLPASSDKEWTAIGIISGVDGCGYQGRPIVHTRVSSFVNWINNNMANN